MKKLLFAFAVLFAVLIGYPSSNADAQTNVQGQWGPVQDWTIIPIHSLVMPDGRVLSFGTDQNGIQGGNFIYNVWDPETNEILILPNTTGSNIFCSNMALDPLTGKVVITGGDQYRYGGAQWTGINDVVMYDYETATIGPSPVGDMNYARWYGSIITLPNGELLEMGGRDRSFNGSTIPEIYNHQTGFRELPGAEIRDFLDDDGSLRGTYYYAKTWVTSGGDVVVVESEGGGASRSDVYRMNVNGQGSVADLGPIPFDVRNLGPAYMFDIDKVVVMDNDGWGWVGDLSTYTPTWTRMFNVPDEDNLGRNVARTNGTFVGMPDGRVALVGGSGSAGLLADSVAYGQKSIFIWDPVTNETEFTAKSNVMRLYHSTAQLLADGRIWTGGGGAPGPYENDNAEVFSPGYLFDSTGAPSDRPQIIDAPTNITAGDTFEIIVDDASVIDRVTAVKVGTATHGSTNEGRLFEPDYTIVDQNTISISTPGPSSMIPGHWMLHVVADGVPSTASMLGVNMVELTTGGPLNPPDTIVYNIDDEQIDGPFEITVDARFDDVAGRSGQKIFDYAPSSDGVADNTERIWLGQVDATNDLEFVVTRNGVQGRIVAPAALIEDEIATWTASVDSQGQMELRKDDVVVAGGVGQVPANIDRSASIGVSQSTCCDDDLRGLVRNLEVQNLTDLPNTAPVINYTTSTLIGEVREPVEGTPPNTGTNGVAGVVAFSDVDVADTHSASAQEQGADYLGIFKHAQPNTTDTTTDGDLWWSFGVMDDMLDFLAEGQTVVQSYNVLVDDGSGGVATAQVDVSIIGANDSPQFTAEGAELDGEVTAISPGRPGDGVANLSTGGTISFTDVDVTDVHSVEAASANENSRGMMTASSTQNDVTWLYQVADADLDDMAVGQTITDTFEVTLTDSSGGTAIKVVTVTINGPDEDAINDAPTIVEESSNLSGVVVELADGGLGEGIDDLTAVGSVVFADPDAGDTHTASFTPMDDDYLGRFKIGTPTVQSDPGSLSWTFTVNDADLDLLAEGHELEQRYMIVLDDGQGADASVEVTVGLSGSLDGDTGNVNCDDKVSIADALIIAQFTVNNRVDTGTCGALVDEVFIAAEADVNRSGTINIGDALLIAQCTAGNDNGYCWFSSNEDE